MPSKQLQFPGLPLRPDKRPRSTGPAAVVASVFQTGLNLMRDLEQKGVRVVGIDSNPDNPGFRSRYGKSFLCPNPDKDPEGWLAFMIALAGAMGEKPVLIAASDLFVMAIGRYPAELQQYFLFSEAGVTLQASLCTKEVQYALAHEYGMPSPLAAHIESSGDLERFCEQAKFPSLLKPRQHREWQALPASHPLSGRKTVSASSPQELLSFYNSVKELVPHAVAQEEIVGPDSAKYCYLSVYATSGERLGYCVVQELRAYPLLYGCASIVEPVVDEEIAEVCDNFLRSVGLIGLCEIEVKRDTRDGRLGLIEVNPRFSGTGDSARYTGVETGFLHYLDLIGASPAPMQATHFGFRHVMMTADLSAFPKYLAEGSITWKQWLRSLRGPIHYFDFDPRDPANARITAWKSIKAFLGGLARTWKLRR